MVLLLRTFISFERKILKNNGRGFELNTLKMTILEP